MNAGNPQRIAVIGLGRFGTALAKQLSLHGAEVIAIDREQDLVDNISGDVALAVRMDSTDEAALRSQEIDRVDALVVAIGEDFESALLTTVICKRNLQVPHVICRAQTSLHAEIFRQIGSDDVIEPEQDAGVMLGRRLAHPRINDYIKLADGFTIVEMVAPQKFVGRTVRQINLRTTWQVNLIAIRRHPTVEDSASEESAEPEDVPTTISVPGPNDQIHANDMLLLAGSEAALSGLPQD